MAAKGHEMEARDSLGAPDVRLGGFQLWVHGRQFPNSNDRDDGNWLRVTAHCGANAASVWAEGAILMTSDLVLWADQCEALHAGQAVEAALSPLEPNVVVILRASDRLGHVRMTVQITPDHMTQEHTFQFELDQSHLPSVVDQCRSVVERYPVRG
jgi:hypothetical protein